MRPPLNGEKTHPLSAHALEELRSLRNRPRPTQEINSGVVNRFQREDLVEEVQLPSPYASHRGRSIAHLRLTAAGLARLSGR